MEIIELFDIEEDEVRRILNLLPVYWYHMKSLPEPSLLPIIRKFNKKDKFVYGIHVFTYGNSVMLTILSEYLIDMKTVSFEILETLLPNPTELTRNDYVEIRISEIIEDILQDKYATPIQIFVCPLCEAVFIINNDSDIQDEMIQCKKCNKSMKLSMNLFPPEL